MHHLSLRPPLVPSAAAPPTPLPTSASRPPPAACRCAVSPASLAEKRSLLQNCTAPGARRAVRACNASCPDARAVCASAPLPAGAECAPTCWARCSALECEPGYSLLWVPDLPGKAHDPGVPGRFVCFLLFAKDVGDDTFEVSPRAPFRAAAPGARGAFLGQSRRQKSKSQRFMDTSFQRRRAGWLRERAPRGGGAIRVARRALPGFAAQQHPPNPPPLPPLVRSGHAASLTPY